MDEAEFYSYTLAEFDSFIERHNDLRRRNFDTPAALISATIANFAGKSAPADTEYEIDDFILRSQEAAEQHEAETREAKGRAQLQAFADRYANIETREDEQ